jgi:hypothetical protein
MLPTRTGPTMLNISLTTKLPIKPSPTLLLLLVEPVMSRLHRMLLMYSPVLLLVPSLPLMISSTVLRPSSPPRPLRSQRRQPGTRESAPLVLPRALPKPLRMMPIPLSLRLGSRSTRDHGSSPFSVDSIPLTGLLTVIVMRTVTAS